jgi:hypothetical protein
VSGKKIYLFVVSLQGMLMQKNLKTAILVAFALETGCATYFLRIPHGTPIFSILYFLAGITIAVLLLSVPELKLPWSSARGLSKREVVSWEPMMSDPLVVSEPSARSVVLVPPMVSGEPVRPVISKWPMTSVRPVLSEPSASDGGRRLLHYRLVAIALLAIAVYNLSVLWFDELPMDVNYADMLPIIKVMGQRFINGESRQVYDIIPWIWKGVQPIYLPAMWLPFVPAVVLDLDMRWITVAGLFFAFSIFIALYRPVKDSYRSFFTAALAVLLFLWLFADNTSGVITASEEGVVIAYYVLLVLALLSGNAFLIGISASLCMLSRYALVGWIPAYLLYLVLRRKGRQAAIIVVTGFACFVLLFLLPVGWSTFLRLAKLPGNYIQFASLVWRDSPRVFSSGMGFAGFFGPAGITLLHILLIVGSFLVPIAGILVCYARSKTKVMANIPLAILKMSLVFFYSFIDVPYQYLFYTSSFVSLLLVTLVVQGEGERAEASQG